MLSNSHLFTDVALIANLSEQLTKEDLKQLLNEHVIGFALYLMPTFQKEVPWLKEPKSQVAVLASLNQSCFLGVYCELVPGRELALASPYRNREVETRLEKGMRFNSHLAKDAFAEEIPQTKSSSEDEEEQALSKGSSSSEIMSSGENSFIKKNKKKFEEKNIFLNAKKSPSKLILIV